MADEGRGCYPQATEVKDLGSIPELVLIGKRAIAELTLLCVAVGGDRATAHSAVEQIEADIREAIDNYYGGKRAEH